MNIYVNFIKAGVVLTLWSVWGTRAGQILSGWCCRLSWGLRRWRAAWADSIRDSAHQRCSNCHGQVLLKTRDPFSTLPWGEELSPLPPHSSCLIWDCSEEGYSRSGKELIHEDAQRPEVNCSVMALHEETTHQYCDEEAAGCDEEKYEIWCRRWFWRWMDGTSTIPCSGLFLEPHIRGCRRRSTFYARSRCALRIQSRPSWCSRPCPKASSLVWDLCRWFLGCGGTQMRSPRVFQWDCDLYIISDFITPDMDIKISPHRQCKNELWCRRTSLKVKIMKLFIDKINHRIGRKRNVRSRVDTKLKRLHSSFKFVRSCHRRVDTK